MQNWEAASRKNKAKLLYLPVVIRKIKFVYDSIRLGHYRLEPFFEIGASSTSNVFDSFIFVFSIILGSVLFSCLDIVCWRWRWKEMEVGQLFPLRCCCCCAFSVPVYLFLLLISFAITIGLYTISLVETAGERIYDDRLDRQAAQVADRRDVEIRLFLWNSIGRVEAKANIYYVDILFR